MPNMNNELNTFGFNMYFPLFKNNIIFHDEQKMSKFINNNGIILWIGGIHQNSNSTKYFYSKHLNMTIILKNFKILKKNS